MLPPMRQRDVPIYLTAKYRVWTRNGCGIVPPVYLLRLLHGCTIANGRVGERTNNARHEVG